MNYVEVECMTCGKKVQKPKSEYNRSMRLGRKFYCNNRCSGLQSTHLLGNYTHNLKRGGDNHSDEFSPFRRHMSSIKSHSSRRKDGRLCTITLQDLKNQWDKQNGKCPYTGWELDNPQSTRQADQALHHIRRASVDRIDSSMGYTKENIQFVCLMAQYAKHTFTPNELLLFCRAVTKNNSQT